MLVKFREFGGLTNVERTVEIDTDEMYEDEAKVVEDLVKEANLIQSRVFYFESYKDMPRIKIRIERDDEDDVEVVYDAFTMPSPAWPLVIYLREQSRILEEDMEDYEDEEEF